MTKAAITAQPRPYSTAAITLHWIIAALIITQIAIGWRMGALHEAKRPHEDIEHLHISVGLTILLFSLARLAVRLTSRSAPMPAMAAWERTLATVTHVLFYVLIIGIPLGGWALVSFRADEPISFWGLFTWPQLPWFGTLTREQGRPLHGLIEQWHGSILIWTTIVLLGLHVLGALKHQFDGHPVLYRMLPFLPKPKA
jgi:cytochrome b561